METKYPSLHTAIVDNIRIHYFHFCYHPPNPGASGTGTLYMNLGLSFAEGVSVILYSVRLAGGQFINPYYSTRTETKTMSFVSPAVARAIAEGWRSAPPALSEKWFLRTNDEAWERLCFDPDKMEALARKPFCIYSPDGKKPSRSGSRKPLLAL